MSDPSKSNNQSDKQSDNQSADRSGEPRRVAHKVPRRPRSAASPTPALSLHANAVSLQAYLVNAWEHQAPGQPRTVCLRVAHHRAYVHARSVVSDYFTVRLVGSARLEDFLPLQGKLLQISGRIASRTFSETLANALRKSNIALELPEEFAGLAITRVTAEIHADRIELADPRTKFPKPAKRVATKKKEPAQSSS